MAKVFKVQKIVKHKLQNLERRFWWIAGGIAICLVVFVLIFAAYRFNWSGAGLSKKTFWDWMQLLIIPVVLALVAIWFNRFERRNEQAISSDNQQEGALQAYLDKMSDLLLKEGLRKSDTNAEVRKIARARTLTVLNQLDGTRKGSLLKFLYEAELIQKDNIIISLVDADLSGAELSSANLSNANLSGVCFDSANFFHANLSNANLSNAALHNASMACATLSGANLSGAGLDAANLRFAQLDNADLSNTGLCSADFHEAKFHKAILTGASFSSFEIKELLTEEQLQQISIITVDRDKMYRTTFKPDL